MLTSTDTYKGCDKFIVPDFEGGGGEVFFH